MNFLNQAHSFHFDLKLTELSTLAVYQNTKKIELEIVVAVLLLTQYIWINS